MGVLLRFAAVLFLLSSAVTARADTLASFSFTLTGSSTPIVTFTLPATLSASDMYITYDPHGNPIEYESLHVYNFNLNGTSILSAIGLRPDQLGFNSNDDLFTGAQVYALSGSSLVFQPGAYTVDFLNYYAHVGLPGPDVGPGVLTVTTTPEPSTLALLSTGLFGISAAVCRRRT